MDKRTAKKEHLLTLGLEVMQRIGYNGTSVKDIVDAANVPKGSFYTYFESKEQFAVEALEHAADRNATYAASILQDNTLNAIQKLQRFFKSGCDAASDNNYSIGCFVGNMCQEMADNNEPIRCLTRKLLRRNTEMIETLLIQAQQEGNLCLDAPTADLAEFIINAWQGALMRMKASKCDEPLQTFMRFLPELVRA